LTIPLIWASILLFLASPIPYLEKMNVRLFNICTNSLGQVGMLLGVFLG